MDHVCHGKPSTAYWVFCLISLIRQLNWNGTTIMQAGPNTVVQPSASHFLGHTLASHVNRHATCHLSLGSTENVAAAMRMPDING